MAMGLEILMQSLGLDPDAIRATIAEVQKQFELVNARLTRMEEKLDAALVTTAVTNGNSERNSGDASGGGSSASSDGGGK